MTGPLPISRLRIWSPSIPMKQKFRHAAAERSTSEPVILEVELAGGLKGYGETHPRTYVTGESHDDILAAIRDVFVPILVGARPQNFGEAIELAASLPIRDATGRVITATRAAVELALLDAYSKAFDRSIESIAGWVSETVLGPPGSRNTVRFSGVISSGDAGRSRSSLLKMWLYGLRDFKLKVGDDEDEERIAACVKALGRGLRRGRATLRLDANGAWKLNEAIRRLQEWESLPITSIEQPLEKGDIQSWAALARQTNMPLMADESLVTMEDAQLLIARGAASWFNIRISKNGGLIPSLRLALLAKENHVDVQMGCMVGETSILSAAGRWFLQLVPDVVFAEGSFGKFLLLDDITRKPLRFGYGGRWRAMEGPGLGVCVDESKLLGLCRLPPVMLPF